MISRSALAVLLVCGAACKGGTGGVAPPATGAGGSGSGSAAGSIDAAPAGAAGSPVAAPPRDLFAAIPAETAFLFATPDPIDAAAWRRIAAELDGPALRARADERMAVTFDPVGRIAVAAWGELGDAIASGAPARTLGVGAAPRFALYGAGIVPVVRIELADPAAMQRAIERVVAAAGATPARPSPQTWIVDGGDATLLVAIVKTQLVVARGPRAVIHAQAGGLVGAAASPIDEAMLRRFAKDHALSTRGVGWVEPSRFAAAAKMPGALAALDEHSPRCKPAVLELIASLPRIALGWSELSLARVVFSVSGELDAATATAIAAARRVAPSLPPKLAGDPLIAASLVAPPASISAAWKARAARVESACAKPAMTSLPAPWNTLEAGALVLYNGTWKGLLPGELDGFAGVLAPRPAEILEALGRAAPSLARNPPKDNGSFVPLGIEQLASLFRDLGIARKDRLLLAASGPAGKAHVGDLAIRDAAPLFRLFVDVARIRARLLKAGTRPLKASAPEDDDIFTADDGDEESSPLASLIGTLDVVSDLDGSTARLRITADVAPPQPRRPSPAAGDPRIGVRDRCRAIVRKSFAATAPALAKLGVTTDLDGIAETYTTSLEANRAIRTCAKLSDAARACLLAAADPIAAAPGCAPSKDGFRESGLELPPLFSFFGPRPLEARFHPPIDGRALRTSLVGTWVQKDRWGSETWTIDGAGNVTITRVRTQQATETKRYRLEVKHAGQIELHEGGGHGRRSLFMPGPDRFYEGGKATPIADESRFVAPLGQGFLIREPSGCSVVTREGALVAARCEVKDVSGARTLRVAYDPPCAKQAPDKCSREESLRFFPGWIVSQQMIEDGPFMRR